ncbi:MAG: cysteine dioxygenase family protein [Actinomycetota bacterium]|nr:cysteine dioxygenase family protein [Actinomycetota bacterium]
MHAVPYLTIPAAGPGDPPALAMSLAAHPERWLQLVDFRPDTRWCRLLECAAGYEVWLLSWLPGQGTDLHDHGPASGAFAVAVGTLTERAVTRGNGVEITRRLTAGRVRAFGPSYVHQVTNTGSMPAVSVHVYAPTLATMNTYRVAPEGLVHVSVEQAGVDW